MLMAQADEQVQSCHRRLAMGGYHYQWVRQRRVRCAHHSVMRMRSHGAWRNSCHA